jgi:hypothetical protein
MVTRDSDRVGWILMNYRVPRDPSTPRIAIWRQLRRLGVALLGDGLVGLPEDARTRERMEWIADQVEAAGGTATLWRARTLSRADEKAIAQQMSQARADEYQSIVDDAEDVRQMASVEHTRQLKRLRRALREVQRRDYFPPPEREIARIAVEQLAASASGQVTSVAKAVRR